MYVVTIFDVLWKLEHDILSDSKLESSLIIFSRSRYNLCECVSVYFEL